MISELNEKKGVVSLLIPLYNHALTIERSLDSVLRSDCSCIELIISNDASGDDSAIIAQKWISLNKFRFESVKLFCQPVNLGINRNLNFLLKEARGEFVTLFASDDELTALAIDIQRQYLLRSVAIDFIFANVGTVDSLGRIIQSHTVSRWRAFFLKSRFCTLIDIVFNWGFPWTRLFGRRAVILKAGFYPEDYSFEDRWAGLIIAESGRFRYIHNVVHLFRLKGEKTATAGLDQGKMFQDIREMELAALQKATGVFKALLRVWVWSFGKAKQSFLSKIARKAVRMVIQAVHRIIVFHFPDIPRRIF